MSKLPSGLKTALFCLIVVLATAGAIEVMAALAFVLRPTGNPLAFPSDEAGLHLFQPSDDGMPYAVKPHYRQVYRSDEFSTTIETNGAGFRENAEFDGQRLDIAVAGDSFTFGHGVEAGERYFDGLRDRFPGRTVMTLAYPNGSEPASYYLFLKQHPQYIPRLLVVGLFAWNDLRDDMADLDLRYGQDGALTGIASRSRAVNPDGYLVDADRAAWTEPWWRRMLREFNAGRAFLVLHHKLSRQLAVAGTDAHGDGGTVSGQSSDLAFEQGKLDATARQSLDFVERLRLLVEERDGRLLVFYIPASYRVGRYSYFCQTISRFSADECELLRRENGLGRTLADWCREHGIAFLDPTPAFRSLEAQGRALYFEKDGHWTREGHRQAGALLAAGIAEAGLLEPDTVR